MSLPSERLQRLYCIQDAPEEMCDIDLVVIAGVGTIQPDEWKTSTGLWVHSLVDSISPKVQAWHFQYSTDALSPLVPQLLAKGRVLLKCMAEQTDEFKRRNIIFICHSLGGLVLKSALCSARKGFNGTIIHSIDSIVFLSTPHISKGHEPNFNIVELILRSNKGAMSKHSISREDNNRILKLCEEFQKAQLQIPFTVVYEGQESRLQINRFIMFRKAKTPPQAVVIDATLASVKARREHIFKINTTHNGVCKISTTEPLYAALKEICVAAVQSYAIATSRVAEYSAPLALRDSYEKSLSRELSRSDSQEQGSTNAESSIERDPEIKFKPQIKLPCISPQSVKENPDFLGREDVLHEIDKCLLPKPGQKIALSTFALCGMGGLGKTQVAIKWMLSRMHYFDAVFWLGADQKSIFAQSLARLAVHLGLEDEKGQVGNLTQSCNRVLNWLSNPVRSLTDSAPELQEKANWLIILDNADDPKVLDDFAFDKGLGSILITSRDPQAKKYFRSSTYGHDLKPLSEEEGAKLMERLTKAQEPFGQNNSLNQVSKLLGGLPLAISQMAGIIVEYRISSYNAFLKLYNEAGAKQLHKLGMNSTKTGYIRNLSTVWALDTLPLETLTMFQVISLLDPDRIPEIILISGAAEVKVESYPKPLLVYLRARANLIKSSLVSINDEKKQLSVHRVVQDQTRAEMDEEQFRKIFQAAVTLLCKVWPFQSRRKSHYISRIDKCEELYPCVVRLKRAFDQAEAASGFQPDDEFAALIHDLGWYLNERGLHLEARPYLKLAQKICENSPNRNHESVAYTLRSCHGKLAGVAAENNLRQESLDHSVIWLSMCLERRTADGHPIVDYELGIVYNETGVAYGGIEDWERAAENFIKSMNTMKKVDNYDETMLSWPEPNLGLIYWIQGRYEEAEIVLNEILEIQATAYGVDDTESFKTGKILHALGNLSWSQGRFDESLDYHNRVFVQYMKTLGASHHRTADVQHRLAMHYVRLDRLAEAEKTINDAIYVFRSSASLVPELARSTFKKSEILRLKGETTEAEKCEKQAANLRKTLVPKDDSKSVGQLTIKDFDCLPMFWSR